jgi:CheY-like chemotaxis protein
LTRVSLIARLAPSVGSRSASKARTGIGSLCYPRAMHILLVEDSEEVSCITVEYLHELGHEVVAVDAAEKAIAELKQRKFDAVMTDIRLPGMSGIDLARELVKDYPRLPVVIASGYGALNIEDLLGQKLPTVLMLPKPYDLPALERTLSEAAAISQAR